MKFQITNFRSIKNQQIEISPITLLYGPNGAGKSGLIYSLLTAKNVILNPNQRTNAFFNYGFSSLGSFEAVVFDHQKDNNIELSLLLDDRNNTVDYQVAFNEDEGEFTIQSKEQSLNLTLPVSFPYQLNDQKTATFSDKDVTYTITWNGVTSNVQVDTNEPSKLELANNLASLLNSPAEKMRRLGVVPLKRGFSKPHYSVTSVTPWLITEDEIATSLSNNKYLVSRISFYLEQIVERDLRVNVQPGTAIFSLDTTDRKTGISSELVNEGFGVNQLVYILAKCLSSDVDWVCIEEPEIHLHPSATRKLAKVLANIMQNEEKQFVISTHSESFLAAFLALVSKGELKSSDLACYFVQKEKKITQIVKQEINSDGQIEGGLSNFMEGELEDLKAFLKTSA